MNDTRPPCWKDGSCPTPIRCYLANRCLIAAAKYEAWRLRFKKDRDDQDAALRDAIAENVALRAELDQAAGVIADRTAELEEATLARGRLRLWLEFIHLNSNDAKEFTAEALVGNAVPEGFEV